MSLAARTAALLAQIEAQRVQRCAALLAPAQAQAQALGAAALREARQRVRTALRAERERVDAVVAAAEARLATEQRLHRQRAASALLTRAWTALRAELQSRWEDPAARAAWIALHTRALPFAAGGTWVIEAPADWPADEADALIATLRTQGASEVRVERRADIAAGLRLSAGHNRVDATVDGLLADRAAIDGQLLALLQSEAARCAPK
jgi:hypothetical protein